jgi:cystathionine gamma-synthase
VSVSLPTWRSNVGYEEGEEWVMSKMKTGYPRYIPCAHLLMTFLTKLSRSRFFINLAIQSFVPAILEKFGAPGEQAVLFPSHSTAVRCVDFFQQQVPELDSGQVRIIDLVSNAEKETSEMKYASPKTSAVLFPSQYFSTAKAFWQHTGEGVSSRRAEYCHELFNEGLLVQRKSQSDGRPKSSEDSQRFCKGPRRYRKSLSRDVGPTATFETSNGVNGAPEGKDSTLFIEERFGRNLELQFAANAKLAIRKRIASSLTGDVVLDEAVKLGEDEATARQVTDFSEEDVYLYPCGMNAIFHAHRSLLVARGQLKSISYGYVAK